MRAFALAGIVGIGIAFAAAQPPESPATAGLQRQRTARAKTDVLSHGCLTCHEGIEPIHPTQTVQIGCAECHGGDATAARPEGAAPGGAPYEEAKRRAHVQLRSPRQRTSVISDQAGRKKHVPPRVPRFIPRKKQ